MDTRLSLLSPDKPGNEAMWQIDENPPWEQPSASLIVKY